MPVIALALYLIILYTPLEFIVVLMKLDKNKKSVKTKAAHSVKRKPAVSPKKKTVVPQKRKAVRKTVRKVQPVRNGSHNIFARLLTTGKTFVLRNSKTLSKFFINGGFIVIFFSIVFLMAGTIIHAQSTPVGNTSAKEKPLVIIIPGYGSQLTPDDYSYIIQNLTSRGYTVKKYYPSFTDISNYQNLVTKWSQGVGTLAGSHKVIVIGHSVGGTVAVHFCANDTRCIASINLDGGPQDYETIPVPNLYIQGDVGAYCDQDCLAGRALATKITANSNGKKVTLKGVKHMNFTDLALNPPKQLLQQGYFGSITAQTAYDEIDSAIDSFLKNVHTT